MKNIFDLDFYDKSLDECIDHLKDDINNDRKVRVYTPNVDHIINIKADKNVFQKYSEAEYIIADGWPVVMTAKIVKKPINKITGVDLMDKLLEVANEKELNIFFLGAMDETLDKLAYNIRNEFPKINVIKAHNGYFKDNEEVIKKINSSKIHMLFVGMGSPKQELWITENIDKINVNIAIAIGGALKIYSKEIERAPEIVQKMGLEWFYRFTKEPNRLFSRYFIKYPKFIKHFYTELKK